LTTIKYNYNFERFDGKSMAYVYYENCNGNVKPNRIYIDHCYIANNIGTLKLLHFILEKYYDSKVTNLTKLSIFMQSCTFVNNQNTNTILSAKCHNDNDHNYCISMAIKDTTVINSVIGLKNLGVVINTYQVKLQLENLTISSTLYNNTIITVNKGLIFSKYNVILNNSAGYAIMASMVYIQENTIINFTLNSFTYGALFSSKQYFYADTIKRCIVQYISERGNLDKEFQMGVKLKYSVIFTNNSMPGLSNAESPHCSWDASSAFQISRPLHVNQKFIHMIQ